MKHIANDKRTIYIEYEGENIDEYNRMGVIMRKEGIIDKVFREGDRVGIVQK